MSLRVDGQLTEEVDMVHPSHNCCWSPLPWLGYAFVIFSHDEQNMQQVNLSKMPLPCEVAGTAVLPVQLNLVDSNNTISNNTTMNSIPSLQTTPTPLLTTMMTPMPFVSIHPCCFKLFVGGLVNHHSFTLAYIF